ncbi:MAG: membrane integrity lipid transport subunit YebS [Plesiomonas sp.]
MPVLKTTMSNKTTRCVCCDYRTQLPPLKRNQNAQCPRCMSVIAYGRDWSLNRLAAVALAILILMPLAFTRPLLEINLFGVDITASVWEGIWQMAWQGFPVTATLVLFCAIVAPLLFAGGIFYLWLARRFGGSLRPCLLVLGKLHEWAMLDVYLLALGVTAFKIRDYAQLSAGFGLLPFFFLVLLFTLLLIHFNAAQLWQRYYPQKIAEPQKIANSVLQADPVDFCVYCHYHGEPNSAGRCPRCLMKMRYRYKQSLQKAWAAVLAAIIMLLPANFLPISVLYVRGTRVEDTIMSGIITLVQSDNIPIATIVFVASILVPLTKVVVMLALLVSVQFNLRGYKRQRLALFKFVAVIGRWSMLDLFVLALMMSLVDRDQILSFTLGPAAFFFGAAVYLTMIAAEWFDTRLIWDVHAKD